MRCRKGIIVHTYKLLAFITFLHVPAALQTYAVSQQKQPSINRKPYAMPQTKQQRMCM